MKLVYQLEFKIINQDKVEIRNTKLSTLIDDTDIRHQIVESDTPIREPSMMSVVVLGGVKYQVQTAIHHYLQNEGIAYDRLVVEVENFEAVEERKRQKREDEEKRKSLEEAMFRQIQQKAWEQEKKTYPYEYKRKFPQDTGFPSKGKEDWSKDWFKKYLKDDKFELV